MEMWLTKGMFGEKVELVAEETDSVKTVMERLFMWKSDETNRRRYKIERYDRMLFGEEGVAVDFGDYSWFMLITGKGSDAVAKELVRQGGAA